MLEIEVIEDMHVLLLCNVMSSLLTSFLLGHSNKSKKKKKKKARFANELDEEEFQVSVQQKMVYFSDNLTVKKILHERNNSCTFETFYFKIWLSVYNCNLNKAD